MTIKQHLQQKKTLLIISIVVFGLLSSMVGYGFYTNTHKFFFEDSRTPDGYGGYALERSSDEFIEDGCGSGTMLDTVTGRCWEKDMGAGTMNWTKAQTHCEDASTGGHSDWRLPSKIELQSLIKETGDTGATSALENFGFTSCQNEYYWSGNEDASYPPYAWQVNLNDGYGNYSDKDVNYYVVCVREKTD